MRVVSALLALGFCFVITIAPALAGPYDGKWIAEMPPQPKPCNATRVMNVLVSDNDVAGTLQAPWTKSPTPFTGKLGPDGTGPIEMQGAHGTIRFSGDHFELNWVGGRCGSEVAMGDRAPSDDQVKQIAAQRDQYQTSFDTMVTKADAGDRSVDYTALRSAYPYTEEWDPYGNKSGILLQQADAAKKGGDCTNALELLDEVIKADFTIDAAHSLRSDCLEDSDRAKSKLESAIADGLIRSLMNSGDGDTEKTAYVVNTMREEMDVLANRHIQLKTRQTEVRGSNGNYYDVVQGISIRTGGGASAKTVYFDVSSLVAGRQSRAAAVTLAAASVH